MKKYPCKDCILIMCCVEYCFEKNENLVKKILKSKMCPCCGHNEFYISTAERIHHFICVNCSSGFLATYHPIINTRPWINELRINRSSKYLDITKIPFYKTIIKISGIKLSNIIKVLIIKNGKI